MLVEAHLRADTTAGRTPCCEQRQRWRKQLGTLKRQMRTDDVEEFPGVNDFRILPILGKVLHVAGDEKVGASSVGAFDENVVVRIMTDGELAGRNHYMALASDQLH